MEKGLLIKAEKIKRKMVTFLMYKKIVFLKKNIFLIYATKCCMACIVSVS